MPPILNPLAVHIQTLKRRLIIIGATILVSMMVAFAFSAEMVAWLNRPFPNPLVFYGPTEALFASIKVSFLAAVMASLPVVFYQLWKFVQPALLPGEQRWLHKLPELIEHDRQADQHRRKERDLDRGE